MHGGIIVYSFVAVCIVLFLSRFTVMNLLRACEVRNLARALSVRLDYGNLFISLIRFSHRRNLLW